MRLLALLCIPMIAGCVTVDPRKSFPDVEADVAVRIDRHVVWNQGTAGDAAATETVRGMLAKELTVDSAVQIALLNNRRLQATYESLGVAQADLVAAGLLKNPVFDADARFSTRGGGTGVDLSLVADFLDVFFIPLRTRIAEAQLASAKLEVSAAVLDLAGDVREAAYDLQAAMQTVEMRQSVVAATAASYDFAKRLHDAGNIPDLQLAREQAAHEEAKLDLLGAQAEVTQLRERLNALMGAWGNDSNWTITPRLPDLPDEKSDPGEAASAAGSSVAETESQAVERSIDLAISRNQVELATRRLGIVVPMGWLSELELGAAAEREVEGGWSVGPAVSLPLPIFSQGQPALAAARSRVRAAAQNQAALVVEVRAAARAARARVVAARQRADYYLKIVLPLRRQITAETQKRLNAMQIGAFELLRTKQEEIDAGRAMIAALRDYWVARGRLETILNGRLPAAGNRAAAPAGDAH